MCQMKIDEIYIFVKIDQFGFAQKDTHFTETHMSLSLNVLFTNVYCGIPKWFVCYLFHLLDTTGKNYDQMCHTVELKGE